MALRLALPHTTTSVASTMAATVASSWRSRIPRVPTTLCTFQLLVRTASTSNRSGNSSNNSSNNKIHQSQRTSAKASSSVPPTSVETQTKLKGSASSASASTTAATTTTGVQVGQRNHEIAAERVLVISEKGESQGEMMLADALAQIDLATSSLVVVSTARTPVVCRVVVHAVEQAHAQAHAQAKAQAKAQEVKKPQRAFKEFEVNSSISAHDLGTKARRAADALAKGLDVHLAVVQRQPHPADPVLARFITLLSPVGAATGPVRLLNKRLLVVLRPKQQQQQQQQSQTKDQNQGKPSTSS